MDKQDLPQVRQVNKLFRDAVSLVPFKMDLRNVETFEILQRLGKVFPVAVENAHFALLQKAAENRLVWKRLDEKMKALEAAVAALLGN